MHVNEIDFSFFEAYKEMNYQWLNETVGISAYDEKFLNNPGEEVTKKGGRIYLAFAGAELVGTFTLMPVNKAAIELTKLTVKKTFRRMGIGEMIMLFSLICNGVGAYGNTPSPFSP